MKNPFAGLFRARDKPRDVVSAATTFSFGGSSAGKSVTPRNAIQVSVVYACVRVIAETIASLPFAVYEETEKGSVKAPYHPLYRIIHDEPNSEMTSFVWREAMLTHLLLWGNPYSQIIRSGRGKVIGLYPLLPDHMEVDRDDKTGKLTYTYSTTKGETVRLRPEDVLHIPGLGFDGIMGYSPIAIEKNAMGVLPNASGVAVHDFWMPYKKYANVDHAMCCAHLERELVYAHETGNQDWAGLLRELLQTLCHRRKVLQSEGKEAFPAQELAGYLERYDKLVDEGLAANPIPERTPGKRGRRAKGKFRCLLERFRDFKDDILRFVRDWRVPYTNNTAERAIRCARVKEKVSGCFRTKSGADDFARVLSFISSAALHGVSSFDAIVAAFRGMAVGVLFGVD